MPAPVGHPMMIAPDHDEFSRERFLYSLKTYTMTTLQSGSAQLAEKVAASQLEEHLEERPPGKATADQVREVLELASEVSVLRDRLDTHERLLDQSGSLSKETVDAYFGSPDIEAQRQQSRSAYI